MQVVDFFCGAGGFSEGFEQAGFKVVKAFDIWEPAIRTHNMNHSSSGKVVAENRNVLEIAALPDEEFHKVVPDSEVIIGSPPCVAFSSSNKSGKADKTLGIQLLKAFFKIVARKKFKKNSLLKYWVMENVSNVQYYVEKEYTMEDLGITTLGDKKLKVIHENSKVYELQYYGVPSNRKRFICGEFPDFNKTLSKGIPLKKVLESLGTPYEYLNSNIVDPNYLLELKGLEVTDHHYKKLLADFEWKKAEIRKRDKGYMGKMSFPEDISKPARTIMATMSHSSREAMIFSDKQGEYRSPTIREVATIMSFPIDYRFYGESDSIKYKLVGNAVPPKFANTIAQAIMRDVKQNYVPPAYRKKVFSSDSNFTNLNFRKFSVKEEKQKPYSTKFKYHVPYLIINSFRVELSNKFNQNKDKVSWNVVIHRGQGKNAEKYENIPLTKNHFMNVEINKMETFISTHVKTISSIDNLQQNYCLPSNQRANLIGPEELLQAVREFIDEHFNNESKIVVENMTREIPLKIAASFYILFNIIGRLKND
ncbi:DNA (cytosine-5)-methyltransferase 1 [Fictibacillus enclensis]|uniref:Cytosine-specific methyltransferase n=1 Tax=Fictibacillus enclensis TaxID=1017270 RepID=A0A0V8JDF3_9BACL|nr:DNA cytosine methyltransferase [Fictibacillus enclensis]KSU85167.1 hypothetical protein AS030_06520 [Fictibacillus enclensis]SCB92058.1 DNA (cytosine-5)-methyltransferase 1 [Fictibacillus enclensis]